MPQRVSEIVVRSFTLRGWKERVVNPGETVIVDRPLRIERMQLISGMPEGQPAPPPRENITISSYFQQGEETALQVTATREGGETHTQLSPILLMGDIRRRRRIPEAVGSFIRHGVLAEYVRVRMTRRMS